MFSRIFKEFEEDPFFRDSFRAHTEHMQHFTRSFSEPFDASVMPSLTDGTSQGGRMAQSNSPHALTQNQRDMSRSLFSFGSFDNTDLMRNPIGIVNNMITNMRNRVDMPRDFENGHSFSSSSVMTYSKVGNEPPKVFQASSSTLRAPGGIKETRQAIKDSESGLQKMAIGHHIQDRGHIMEKKFNNKTGEKEFNQDFQNLDESEAEAFDEEFKQKVSTVKSDGHRSVSITFNQEQGHREQPRIATKREPGSKRQ
ncbi:myeloid leukemia factor 1 [Periophthalmus magnuspinnatus]|uniref:myeloid leukemia factor 1 n=1 Tax=Periophthalmus magnuspinnatus TaxID=409849 RepID=UPI00145A6C5A|nr:myeloid leukemia factor 1 [Periophthalmus magnuspinnatus]